MANTYEKALELGEVYGIPSEDVPFQQYLGGIIMGTRQFESVPPVFSTEGKDYTLTSESIAEGLRLGSYDMGQSPSTPEEASESFRLFGLRKELGCCVLTAEERYMVAVNIRKGATACGGMVFGGLFINEDGALVAAAMCPASVVDKDLPVKIQDKTMRYHGGIYITPSVLSPESALDLVEKATPHTPKDAAVIIKDMLKRFAFEPKVQTFWSAEMDMGNRDNEPRDYQAEETLDRIARMHHKNKKRMADDFSMNKSAQEIAAKIFEGKLRIFEDTLIGPQQLAAVWLHLNAAREYAVRTKVTY